MWVKLIWRKSLKLDKPHCTILVFSKFNGCTMYHKSVTYFHSALMVLAVWELSPHANTAMQLRLLLREFIDYLPTLGADICSSRRPIHDEHWELRYSCADEDAVKLALDRNRERPDGHVSPLRACLISHCDICMHMWPDGLSDCHPSAALTKETSRSTKTLKSKHSRAA